MRPVLWTCLLALTLTACGPGADPAKQEAAKAKVAAAKSARGLPTGPVIASTGTVISLTGRQIVLDHEGAAGGLPAGRTTFQVDASVLAEAPIEPGARVAFGYQDWTPEPLLVELKGR